MAARPNRSAIRQHPVRKDAVRTWGLGWTGFPATTPLRPAGGSMPSSAHGQTGTSAGRVAPVSAYWNRAPTSPRVLRPPRHVTSPHLRGVSRTRSGTPYQPCPASTTRGQATVHSGTRRFVASTHRVKSPGIRLAPPSRPVPSAACRRCPPALPQDVRRDDCAVVALPGAIAPSSWRKAPPGRGR